MKKLNKTDIGRILTYVEFDGSEQKGKLKAFDNEKQIAWIVYKCNNNWDRFKDYTAAATKYSDIKELQE